MRTTALALLLLPLSLAADPFGNYKGPFPYTLNGIGYITNFDPALNTVVNIQAFFSAPVSSFEYSVIFPREAVNPIVWTVCPGCSSTITWTALPRFAPGEAMATVNTSAPNITQMAVTLQVDRLVPSGPLYPAYFQFWKLTGPSGGGAAAIQQTPEPGTAILGGFALVMPLIARRWWTRGGVRF